MLKRIFAKFRPSPAMMVALLGVALGLGSTGWAANGGAFVLGVINGATQRTALGANYNGTALALSNTSTGAAATALTLTVAAGRQPMKVNSVTKVTNLNADYVDGLNSTALTRAIRVNFNLASGAVSPPITVPASVPVQLVGADSGADSGVGQASLLRFPLDHIAWVGLSGSAISTGSDNTSGRTIVYVDYLHHVSVELAGPDAIRVHNVDADTQSGSVTLMW